MLRDGGSTMANVLLKETATSLGSLATYDARRIQQFWREQRKWQVRFEITRTPKIFSDSVARDKRACGPPKTWMVTACPWTSAMPWESQVRYRLFENEYAIFVKSGRSSLGVMAMSIGQGKIKINCSWGITGRIEIDIKKEVRIFHIKIIQRKCGAVSRQVSTRADAWPVEDGDASAVMAVADRQLAEFSWSVCG
ncbi:hypothetical protein EVAR_94271_1 [Eumeta japonica]|uniref:Uncharacterized protein n=1 Tax=Eumeta variegata TaxID=151549 RepID=A0A4C1UFT3_EUMVA|nr:hypothetical protein EVAR_94271_1 [Eumeta japonica]